MCRGGAHALLSHTVLAVRDVSRLHLADTIRHVELRGLPWTSPLMPLLVPCPLAPPTAPTGLDWPPVRGRSVRLELWRQAPGS